MNDTQEIDDILSSLEEEKPDKEISILEKKKEIAITTIRSEDDLIDLSIKKSDNLEIQADKVFEMFYDTIAKGTDRSSASKEQMLEALKIKLEINKSIIEAAKVKKKETASNKLGIMINTMKGEQAGIDIDSIMNSI